MIEVKVGIHKLNRGRFQTRYRDPRTRKIKRNKFSTRKLALAHAKLIREEILGHGLGPASRQTVGAWMKRYEEHDPKPFMQRLGKYVRGSFMAKLELREVGSVAPQDVVDWMTGLQRERNLSPYTIPNLRCAANKFFNFVKDSGAIRVNPVTEIKAKVKRDAIPRRRRVILKEEKLGELLGHLRLHSASRIFPIVFFLIKTGARVEEALNLRWDRVNFENKTVHFLKTKNASDRLIQVPPEVLDLLRSLKNSSTHVFLNWLGKPWTTGQYQKQYQTVKRKFHLGCYWNNHNLRHSYAVNFLKAGGDIIELQHHLGHRDLSMTVNLYGKIESEELPPLDLYSDVNLSEVA